MRTYPLIRRRLSNEHVMTVLFAVILLYLLPQWLQNPKEMLSFTAVLVLSLILDAVAGFIRYKQLVCSVSAAVTAGILQVITPGIPLWGRLVGIAAAILLGKQIWGGTGKNTLNPAIVGYLLVTVIFGSTYAPIDINPVIIILPAVVFSLPFILVRPFASVGFISGMVLSMLTHTSSAWPLILTNSIFFGCLVLTDPVTITPKKLTGLIGGFISGFLPLILGDPAITIALCILLLNLISYLIDDLSHHPVKRLFYIPPVLKSVIQEVDYSIPSLDLTGRKPDQLDKITAERGESTEKIDEIISGTGELTPDIVLKRLAANNVYGNGGAAFPTAEKIKAVIESNTKRKYLIINGVECDPGLIHDKWLLRNLAEEIYRGIKVVSQCADFAEVILAVKNTEGLAFPEEVKLRRVKNFYPAGFEKTLIEHVVGIKLDEESIPSVCGILVLNVQTLISVYEAVCLNKPAIDKYITVSDLKAGVGRTVKVRIGENIWKTAGAVYPGQKPVFTGGGVMQAHMTDDLEIIKKDTNFIAVSNLPRYKESPLCSNCSACVSNCPKGLQVHRIAELVDAEKYDEAARFRPDQCIRCGICSYVCLAGKNLSARVGEAKDKVNSLRSRNPVETELHLTKEVN